MADATVTQGRRDEPLPLSKEPASITPSTTIPFAARPLRLIWLAIVLAIAAFVAFGTVRIGAGNWTGLRMSVRRIWGNYARFLTEQGASTAMVGVVTVAALSALIGSAVLLWLAFSVRDQPGDALPEDSLER